ncbi:MAG: dual specificity protein phosphatase family protein [Desulfobulbaceae bacterium]|uniref:Dual specificity protein phosphatase family protein n=1 Tax=Candidatus Desulfobia pelagia TaxID=2841692 RepID=A0A8J6NDG7_9BACT|nr:dual specificity protein phosphatase family protein [Candidatus Desulfobia pelagia]
MSEYELTWVTESLAVGHAPMSYAELDDIRSQGIDAIINLCGEFCDLHEIEEKSGFEVYYIPIPDETAPDMAELEKGLDWLDEAIYLGKKVLVHCRHGIGRTGTLVTGYLIRRGLGLKMAEKKLKGTRSQASNYSQWRLLKKYGKKSGKLTIREPSLESGHLIDLSSFFMEYESLVSEVENKITGQSETNPPRCGINDPKGCYRYFELQFIEAIYLGNKINKTLTAEQRQQAIERAVDVWKQIRAIVRNESADSKKDLEDHYLRKNILCPLYVDGCQITDYRPLSCRLYGIEKEVIDMNLLEEMLTNISRSLFMSLSGFFPEKNLFLVSCADTVSGRFAQIYFHFLASLENQDK